MSNATDNIPTADELVAAVQALQDERDDLCRRLHSIGRHDGAAYISRRPSWADRTTMGAEVITYTWTAPTVAECLGETDLVPYPVKVEVIQEEDLYVNQDGVVLDRGPMRIIVSDLSIDDTVNGRKLAAALIECCDRIDGVGRTDTITSDDGAR